MKRPPIVPTLTIALAATIALAWRNHRRWLATADTLEEDRERVWTKLRNLRSNALVLDHNEHPVPFYRAVRLIRDAAETKLNPKFRGSVEFDRKAGQ